MGLQKGRHAFKYLVCVEAAHHHRRRRLHHKSHSKGQGDDDHPDADQVHLHHEHGIAAATDDAVVGGHLVGHTHTDHAQDDEERIHHPHRLRGQVIERHNGDADQKEEQAGHKADHHEHPLHDGGVMLHKRDVARPDSLSHNDRRGGGSPHSPCTTSMGRHTRK